ncbi:ribonuclease III [Candidatus Woesebacteria bacterium]|nr:ribonuclease III [Candidatus Woesebacteria bacterium]MCD8507258.1 ribonuclease III [Candidatus Woesebacteria bacterium]MCD8526607.1 ribonuclease III [Candidatus Woesebacteria bacterium]MCD8546002.1 ribonuclease III [Candidatus Woesebacteria bacterium]
MSAPFPPELADLSESLRNRAFTHRSLRAQSVARHETNERLEFLGDAVLELVISEFLIAKYPKLDEGTLTRYRASLVRTESLATVARDLQLGEHLHLGTMEPIPAEDLSDSILADTCEAVIGAIHRDKGYAAAEAFIHKYLLPHLPEFITTVDAKDAKTLLQEKVQALGGEAPQYEIVEESGPDHDKIFTAAVVLPGYEPFTGKGASKQKAEQAAAAEALKQAFALEENLI